MSKIIPVILSGGSGTRLWPVSTDASPKQFQPLTGNGSMFLQTLGRAADRARFAAPLVVCGDAHVAHVEADLAAVGIADARIIVEPARALARQSIARTSSPRTYSRSESNSVPCPRTWTLVLPSSSRRRARREGRCRRAVKGGSTRIAPGASMRA